MHWQLCNLALTGLLAAGVMPAQQRQSTQVPASDNAAVVASLSTKFDKRLAHMTRRYKLTADQQAQMQAILLKQQEDMQTVGADTYMSAANKREEVATLHEASQLEIRAILNEKQKRKFDADEKRRAWMEGRLPEPNPGPPFGSW